jgi:hypothetical protein
MNIQFLEDKINKNYKSLFQKYQVNLNEICNKNKIFCEINFYGEETKKEENIFSLKSDHLTTFIVIPQVLFQRKMKNVLKNGNFYDDKAINNLTIFLCSDFSSFLNYDILFTKILKKTENEFKNFKTIELLNKEKEVSQDDTYSCLNNKFITTKWEKKCLNKIKLKTHANHFNKNQNTLQSIPNKFSFLEMAKFNDLNLFSYNFSFQNIKTNSKISYNFNFIHNEKYKELSYREYVTDDKQCLLEDISLFKPKYKIIKRFPLEERGDNLNLFFEEKLSTLYESNEFKQIKIGPLFPIEFGSQRNVFVSRNFQKEKDKMKFVGLQKINKIKFKIKEENLQIGSKRKYSSLQTFEQDTAELNIVKNNFVIINLPLIKSKFGEKWIEQFNKYLFNNLQTAYTKESHINFYFDLIINHSIGVFLIKEEEIIDEYDSDIFHRLKTLLNDNYLKYEHILFILYGNSYLTINDPNHHKLFLEKFVISNFQKLFSHFRIKFNLKKAKNVQECVSFINNMLMDLDSDNLIQFNFDAWNHSKILNTQILSKLNQFSSSVGILNFSQLCYLYYLKIDKKEQEFVSYLMRLKKYYESRSIILNEQEIISYFITCIYP